METIINGFKTNRAFAVTSVLVLVLIAIAFAAPVLAPYDPTHATMQDAFMAPGGSHLFGTDKLGRDCFSRVLYGARASLSGVLFLVASVFIVGTSMGVISGYFGGRIDSVMMRIVDILYGIPLLLYVILLMVVLKPGLLNVFIALGLVYWLRMARIVRAQVLGLKELEFVLAARVLGASPRRLIFGHLLPNSLGPIIVTLTLSIPEAIFIEAFLSFIGLGVSAPMASWGVLASEGVVTLRSYPFQLLWPAVAISLTMLGFNFLGDGLRDALDPRMRR